MTRLRALVADIAALLRGEPVLAVTILAIAGDLQAELRGDGLQWAEVPRLVVTAVLGAIVRSAVTPVAAPVVPTLPTDPALPAPTTPVLTLSGWRR